MKKTFLILGIVLIAAAVILLALSGLYYYIHHFTMDASGDFYHRAYRNYTRFFIGGAASAAGSIVMFVLRKHIG